MRIPLRLVLLLAAGCGGPDDQGTPAASPAGVDDRIDCAIAGADRYAKVCEIDPAAADDPLLTIRHPDGGFRRLQITRDGRGVIAADGAAAAAVQVLADGRIEVTIDGDRYRLPATIPAR